MSPRLPQLYIHPKGVYTQCVLQHSHSLNIPAYLPLGLYRMQILSNPKPLWFLFAWSKYVQIKLPKPFLRVFMTCTAYPVLYRCKGSTFQSPTIKPYHSLSFWHLTPHFVWQGCRPILSCWHSTIISCGGLPRKSKSPQFLTLDTHFVREGCVSWWLVGTTLF